MEWSPQDAMKAYLQTLHMYKLDNSHEESDVHDHESKRTMTRKKGIIEPKGLELISALAAGNKSRVIVEIITSKQGITPLTVALAIAAKQTGGKLICIVPTHDHLTLGTIKEQLSLYGLDVTDPDRDQDPDLNGFIELRIGDPCEQIKSLKDVDFAVFDCKCDPSSLRSVSEKLHLNPKGAIIVGNNIVDRDQGVAFVDQLIRGKKGVESSVTTLPLGSAGVQLIIRIKSIMSKPQRRRHKRFLVTFDE